MPTSPNMIQYFYGLEAAYKAKADLGQLDENAIYVLTDRQAMFKGNTLISANNVRTVEKMPSASEAFDNILYVVKEEKGTVLAVKDPATQSMTTLINTSKIDTFSDNVKLSSAITLSLAGKDLGGITNGTTFEEGTTLTTILNKLMRKEEPAAISTQTSVSITVSNSADVECGTTVTPTVTPSFNKGAYKYGPDTAVTVTNYTLTENIGGVSSEVVNQASLKAYTPVSPITIPDGTVVYTAKATHSDGAAANSSFGNPSESVKIKGGTVSATKSIAGKRNLFYVSDSSTAVAEDSQTIRALGNKKLGPSNKLSFDIDIPQGAKRVIFAYPKSLQVVTSVTQDSTNMSAKGSFVETEVSVEGANGYAAVSYRVYTYISKAPLNKDTFKVQI